MTQTDVDLDEVEDSLSKREEYVFETLREAYLDAWGGRENAEEEARTVALLDIREERKSAKAGRSLVEEIQDSDETTSETLAELVSDEAEGTQDVREYLEEIGVLPIG